jgi:hypothetical protein
MNPLLNDLNRKKPVAKSTTPKEIDHEKTIKNMRRNKEFENFIHEKLVRDKRSFKSKIAVLNNFFTLVQMALVQVLIPLFPEKPGLVLALLAIAEVMFYGFIIYPYYSKFKFISVVAFISKTCQFVTFEGFLIVSLMINSRKRHEFQREEVAGSLQKIGRLMIVSGIALDYFFLIVNLGIMVRNLVKERKKKGIQRENKEELIIYKESDEQGDELEGNPMTRRRGQTERMGMNKICQRDSDEQIKKSKYSIKQIEDLKEKSEEVNVRKNKVKGKFSQFERRMKKQRKSGKPNQRKKRELGSYNLDDLVYY